MGEASAVRLEGVTYAYPRAVRPALVDIDLEVPAGQCVVVTGRSGCGKTTLTRMINGLVPHVYAGELGGRVLVEGTDVAQWAPEELGVRVGSVFQNPRSQFVNLDVASEIAFGCENLGLAHEAIVERVIEAAHALGIAELLDRSIEELSGGQRQAVILASAFAMHPNVFVLDEPTASLDVSSMQRLARVVSALKDEGKTVIVSEHRLWWLSGIADRVIRMEDGAIVGDWTAAEYATIPAAERMADGMRAWTLAEMEEGAGNRVRAIEREERKGAQGAQAVLVAEDLVVSYGRHAPVLDGVSLDLVAGSIVGIVGRNGAGKTTLLRTLSGLTHERAGGLVVDGQPLRFRARPEAVHLVMQEPGYQLFADAVHGELPVGEEEARCLLEAFGLAALADRHPLSLSGGERQRLAIAAGVARGARILVLDEPTSGLDRDSMERVVQALQHVAATGACIALVTHDYEFLCSACDEVVEVSSGSIFARYPLDAAHVPRVRSLFGS